MVDSMTRRLPVAFAAFALAAGGAFGKASAPRGGEAGFADADGNWVSSVAAATNVVRSSDWGVEPLGSPGTLVVDTAFKVKPSFLLPPARNLGPVLVGADGVMAVVAPTEKERALADEIAWHLSEMCGRKVPVAADAPASGPAIILAFLEDKGEETSSIRTEGDRVHVSGAGAGLSHAVTYFLEALGIRYLWPGRLGKVIPRRAEVTFPEMDWRFVPQMRVRGMRGGMIAPWAKQTRDRALVATRKIGLDPEAFRTAVNTAYVDHPGNRDFFVWHGLKDNPDSFGASGRSDAPYKWGHSFKWTHGKDFAAKHPDFIALQPDGTRTVKNGRTDRACFCLSNPAFVERTIQETIADFHRRATKKAIAIGLPDGGGGSPCMCERCRRLDPPNAPPRSYPFRGGVLTPYVSMTDRTLWFFNQIAEGALKACPDRKGLTFFPYSYYTDPPVSVRPDPRLIPLSVAGNYTDAKQWGKARENVAAWINFGLETYWRPNCMWGWHACGPQNFARRMFDDFETMKANGLKGCDFDCVDNSWAAKGLLVYVICRSALNMDRLPYDAILDDYCSSGFGAAAAPVRDYFAAVEGMTAAAAQRYADEPPQKTADFRGSRQSAAYLMSLDCDRLASILARAEAAAKGDADVIARIRFLAVAVEYGRRERTLCETRLKGDDAVFAAAQKAFAEFVQEAAMRDPLAQNPCGICFYDPLMCTYDSAKPKKRKKKGAGR